jgi:tetratricopeptide (TPR) repeat protein
MPYFGATTLAHVLKDLQGGQALPASGKGLVNLLALRKGAPPVGEPAQPAEIMTAPALRPPSSTPPAGAPSRRLGLGASTILKMLEGLTYVEAVLWIAERLADGLAHAHEWGILHRDLKPANVLLTDEGQPMLLDFNLSEDTKLRTSAAAAHLGGTLPYMAPEHLEALQGGTHPMDARSDLYAFGVILYKLLTGRQPSELPRGPLKSVLPRLIADRRQPPPTVRRWNPAVSPAVESVIRHCLEPEPGRRYQTAQELQEDLQRQRENLPLRYAAEPSLRERARKWRRRHPRLMSSTTVGLIAALLFLGLASLLLVRGRHLTRLEAVTAKHQLGEDLKVIRFQLSTPDAERQQREEGMALGRRLLDRYRVLETRSWQEGTNVSALSAEERQRLRADMGELLLLLARSTARQAEAAPDPEEQLAFALRLNALAEGCYPPDAGPRALYLQRAELTRLAGRGDEARRLHEQAEATPVGTARDRYLLIADYLSRGDFRAAQPFLREASNQNAYDFSVWLMLGNCCAGLGQPASAEAYYDLGIALWPNAHWGYFRRGVLHLDQKNYRQARADFDAVLRLRPDLQPAYFNRALAQVGLEDYVGAREDLTRLLEQGPARPSVYFVRARVREREGDREGARRDREEGFRQQPIDEKDWTDRGLARLPRDPQAALADFDKALQLNPHYRAAMQNKASVLAEYPGREERAVNLAAQVLVLASHHTPVCAGRGILSAGALCVYRGRTEEAVGVLDQVLSQYPDFVLARAGRGVLLARLGKHEAAHADAQAALQRDTKPSTLYQVAGIYALTSRQNTGDRQEALRLLSAALQRGYGLELLARDRDLDPVRDQPEFRRIVEAARALRAKGPPPAAKP